MKETKLKAESFSKANKVLSSVKKAFDLPQSADESKINKVLEKITCKSPIMSPIKSPIKSPSKAEIARTKSYG